jgi:uncharacterized protein YggE
MARNMRTITAAATVAIGLITAPMPAARAADAPTVTVTGSATGTYRPDVLRVKVLLTADGKDAAAAVAALAAKREGVRKGLADAGASSVAFSPTNTGAAALTPQQRQMAALMAAQRGNHHAPSTQPGLVTVSTVATADFPLSAAASDDEALVAGLGLEGKVKAAVASSAQRRVLSPEEQEAAEEGAAEQSNPMMPAAAKPGEPDFTFVHKLSPDERAKLTTDAVAQARGDADRLARATGGTLGAVVDVTARAGGGADSDNPIAAIIQAETGAASAPPAASGEVADAQPGTLSSTVQVTVKYALTR